MKVRIPPQSPALKPTQNLTDFSSYFIAGRDGEVIFWSDRKAHPYALRFGKRIVSPWAGPARLYPVAPVLLFEPTLR
jgi:hypothetical protein